MSVVTVVSRRVAKGVKSKIETCDTLNCTKSGQFEAWILDHKYYKWLLCTSCKNEMISLLEEILPSKGKENVS